MQFFDEAQQTPEKIGKAIGNVLAALVYLGVIGLMLSVAIR
jgi:hypothetical protein